MLAQRLRHQITIEQQALSLNAYRENVGAWSTYATCFAGVEPVSGKEYATAGAVLSETSTRFVLRYEDAPAVTAQMRVLFNGKYYEVVEVINEMQRDRMISLMCKVGVSDG